MFLKVTFLMLALLFYCDCVYVYSSFWAPLFNQRILNYRVDAKFDPNSGKSDRELYEANYGYRGANLIADLGNGKGPNTKEDESYGDVKFYYTYKGANENAVNL